MTTSACESVVINGERVAETLKGICGGLPSDGSDVLLDFFLVQSVDPAAIKELEDLAEAAKAASVKVILRGINVEIYKVLKLADLTDKFLFLH